MTARQLQDAVLPAIARARLVPNEIRDAEIFQFCFKLADLETTKGSGGNSYVEPMLESGAREWLAHYAQSRSWRVRFLSNFVILHVKAWRGIVLQHMHL